ncbi:hypothetical protein B0H17DRAFT_541356 [Mycena rosella]|uniref:Uncharacterized protein n=1 Tax=Mycena rosella TaxID=1033263 RepID=A0AAD7GJV3_MYCRO|nr:hypothetical protein B0H17DRAFT_541356 [Mycena rosella]
MTAHASSAAPTAACLPAYPPFVRGQLTGLTGTPTLQCLSAWSTPSCAVNHALPAAHSYCNLRHLPPAGNWERGRVLAGLPRGGPSLPPVRLSPYCSRFDSCQPWCREVHSLARTIYRISGAGSSPYITPVSSTTLLAISLPYVHLGHTPPPPQLKLIAVRSSEAHRVWAVPWDVCFVVGVASPSKATVLRRHYTKDIGHLPPLAHSLPPP